jgi:hypothetical protein
MRNVLLRLAVIVSLVVACDGGGTAPETVSGALVVAAHKVPSQQAGYCNVTLVATANRDLVFGDVTVTENGVTILNQPGPTYWGRPGLSAGTTATGRPFTKAYSARAAITVHYTVGAARGLNTGDITCN